MQWFDAVKPDMPYTSQGLNVYPSAGPYYISSRDPGRTHGAEAEPVLQGLPPGEPGPDRVHAERERRPVAPAGQGRPGRPRHRRRPADGCCRSREPYGVNKGRFFVGPTSCVDYMGLNTARAPFDNVNLRKAVN